MPLADGMQCRAIRKQCAVPQNGNAVASIRATIITVTADSLMKQDNTHNAILYALRPMHGKAFTSELDRKFAAATMYIDLSPGEKAERPRSVVR